MSTRPTWSHPHLSLQPNSQLPLTLCPQPHCPLFNLQSHQIPSATGPLHLLFPRPRMLFPVLFLFNLYPRCWVQVPGWGHCFDSSPSGICQNCDFAFVDVIFRWIFVPLSRLYIPWRQGSSLLLLIITSPGHSRSLTSLQGWMNYWVRIWIMNELDALPWCCHLCFSCTTCIFTMAAVLMASSPINGGHGVSRNLSQGMKSHTRLLNDEWWTNVTLRIVLIAKHLLLPWLPRHCFT